MARKTEKKALITGIAGQDGSYLAEFLAEKNYEIHGLLRWKSDKKENQRINRIVDNIGLNNIKLHFGDLANSESLGRIISCVKPDEVYNLAAMSHVGRSNEMPEYTGDVNGLGAIRILEALRLSGKKTRFYQASTSEMFGNCARSPQNEQTPFNPASPYGLAKLYAHYATVYYRNSLGMHASNGILFNHESPRRGEEFVTRKITMGVARVALGINTILHLGNLNAKRDWGHAKDYVRGIWMIARHAEPGDFVLASGKTRSIREFAEAAFASIGVGIEWKGKGLKEVGINKMNGQTLVAVNKDFFRPDDVNELTGDASKAEKTLGWKPEISFEDMVDEMVKSDMEATSRKGM